MLTGTFQPCIGTPMGEERKSTRGVCDFIFLIDSTASMGPCMDALKENIGVFIDALNEGHQGQSPVRDWRGKVVAYRDTRYDGSDWLEVNPFVQNDADALKAQLASLVPHGGGDEPESLLDALYVVASMEQTPAGAEECEEDKWRHRREAARVVIVFTDATYHPEMTVAGAEGGMVQDVAHQLMANRIMLNVYAPDHACYDELSQIDKCEWEPIPGPDFVAGLAEYTSNQDSFQKALMALAKSVSKSTEIELL